MSEFHEFLKDFKAGHLDANLTNKMMELVEAVTRFQKEGKLTIKISLRPKAEGEIMTAIKFKMEAPERDTIESIMFVTPENNLIDSNPKQPELFERPVREISKPSVITKSI